MENAGFWMLASAAIAMIASGLPAFIVLIGVSVLFAAIGIAAGAIPYELLTALPQRITGLLENDLLQALPLYVAMGALLNRLPLADILFRAGCRIFAGSAGAPLLAAIGLGALIAPMNGSVGASVATLSRVVQPRLEARGVAAPQSLATICVASTLGVVIPPSLVLILLGDTMLRAHTEAVNATGVLARVINTQDVFRGTLVPAAIFLALSLALAWWQGRRARPAVTATAMRERLSLADWLTAAATLILIAGLLTAVTVGYLYAVEGAAAGAVALFLFGLATRTLTREVASAVMRDTMAVTGALFALFVAATTFTLVFRAFGTDQRLAALMIGLPGGTTLSALCVLVILGLCGLVLDAFEIILVVVPLVMPPLLIRVPDAVWMSALTLLALQASFLVPPFGYAVMMARTAMARPPALGAAMRALAPYLALQLLVLALTLAAPAVTHLAQPSAVAGGKAPLSDDEVRRKLDRMIVPPPDADQ